MLPENLLKACLSGDRVQIKDPRFRPTPVNERFVSTTPDAVSKCSRSRHERRARLTTHTLTKGKAYMSKDRSVNTKRVTMWTVSFLSLTSSQYGTRSKSAHANSV